MNDEVIGMFYEIRRALESFDKLDYGGTLAAAFSGFPYGCCGNTTELLGLYLSEHHDLDSIYVKGSGLDCNLTLKHAWLVCDGYSIDITADQFNHKGYTLPAVIISKSSRFHQKFHRYEHSQQTREMLEHTDTQEILDKIIDYIKCSSYL